MLWINWHKPGHATRARSGRSTLVMSLSPGSPTTPLSLKFIDPRDGKVFSAMLDGVEIERVELAIRKIKAERVKSGG